MNCRQYRDMPPGPSAEAKEHLASCADCRLHAEIWNLIGEYPVLQPGPDFFQGIRRKLAPRVLRFAAPIAGVAAALLIGVVLILHPISLKVPTVMPPVSPEEKELVENLEILENYDLLKTLEIVGEARSPLMEGRK